MTDEQLQSRLVDLQRELAGEFAGTRRLDAWSVGFDWVAGCVPFACYVEVNADVRGFSFRAVWHPPFPPERRGAAAEYLHRVNYSVFAGGWAIDLDNGDVRWKSGLYFGDGELTTELMREVLGSSFSNIREHVTGLLKVFNGEPVAAALAVIGRDTGEGSVGG